MAAAEVAIIMDSRAVSAVEGPPSPLAPSPTPTTPNDVSLPSRSIQLPISPSEIPPETEDEPEMNDVPVAKSMNDDFLERLGKLADSDEEDGCVIGYGASPVKPANLSTGLAASHKSGAVKKKALTAKQLEAQRLAVHSESQRILRTGPLNLPRKVSSLSKAPLSEFIKPGTRFAESFQSTPANVLTKNDLNQTGGKAVTTNASFNSNPVSLDAQKSDSNLSQPSSQSNSNSLASSQKMKRLQKLLGKSIPDLPTTSQACEKGGPGPGPAADKAKVKNEIMLVKSEEEERVDRIITRVASHCEKKKQKPVKKVPETTAASAIDENVFTRIIAAKDDESGRNVSSAPGRSLVALKDRLRQCMLAKMKERHDVRCELFEQEQAEYNEKMGYEEGAGEEPEEDEDYNPEDDDEQDGSGEEEEDDSGDEYGSDVNGEGEGKDRSRGREKNEMIDDEAEEDDEENEEGDEDGDVDECKDNLTVRSDSSMVPLAQAQRSCSVTSHLSFGAASSISGGILNPAQAQANTSKNRNDTFTSNESFQLPTYLRANSSNAEESFLSQTNLFDDNGFIITEKEGWSEEKSEKHDAWLKSLLNTCPSAEKSKGGQCDEEVEKLCSASAAARGGPVSSKVRPSSGAAQLLGDEAVVDPADLSLLCSGAFAPIDGKHEASQVLFSPKGETGSDSLAMICSGVFPSQIGEKASENSENSCSSNIAIVSQGPSTLKPLVKPGGPCESPSSLDGLAMMCSAPFPSTVPSQGQAAPGAHARSQSSPLENDSKARLESPALDQPKSDSPTVSSGLKNNELGGDNDDEEEEFDVRMTQKKSRRKKLQISALQDSDEESEAPTSGLKFTFDDVPKLDKSKSNNDDNVSAVNSTVLFSETETDIQGASNVLKEDQSLIADGAEKEKALEEGSGDNKEGQEKGKKLRRVIMDDDDDDESDLDGDADDENEEDGSDVEDEDGEFEGEDEGEYDDYEAEEGEDEEEAPKKISEELLEFRRASIKKKMKEFMEEEAELSGSDVGEDEDDERGMDYGGLDPDQYEQEGLDDNISISEARLRAEVGRMYQEDVLDEEQRGLRLLQEALIDEEEDGMKRIRQFRWAQIDENAVELFHNDNSDDDGPGVLNDPADAVFGSQAPGAAGGVTDAQSFSDTARARLDFTAWLSSQKDFPNEDTENSMFLSAIGQYKSSRSSALPSSSQSGPTCELSLDGDLLGSQPGEAATAASVAALKTQKSMPVAAELATIPINAFFNTSSTTPKMARHNSFLSRAHQKLSFVADKLKDKFSGNSGKDMVKGKPLVDTKNMIFKPKDTDSQDGSLAASQGSRGATPSQKRKAEVDESSMSGSAKKLPKLDMSGVKGGAKKSKPRRESLLLTALD